MRRALIALLVLGLPACGGRKVINFPVDDSRLVSTLTPAELQSMCNAMAGSVGDALHAACLAQGVGVKFQTGGTEQSCQSTMDSCLAKYAHLTPSCDLIGTKNGLSSCNATVGEYELCVNDGLALIDSINHRLSCSMSLSDLQSVASDMQAMEKGPPSCQELSKKCPQLSGGMGGG